MEKRYGCEIEDYLTGEKTNTNQVAEDRKSYRNDSGSGDLIIPGDEHDYTIEHFLFFDNFVKEMQLLNIFHIACMESHELLGVRKLKNDNKSCGLFVISLVFDVTSFRVKVMVLAMTVAFSEIIVLMTT